MSNGTIIFSLRAAIGLSVAASAHASTLQGDVRGLDGGPSKGAEVRVDRKDKNAPVVTTKTNVRGHYSVKGISVGLYTVSIKDGALGSSVTVKTTGNDARIDFDLKPAAAKKVKHYVWVPARTGSHLGGGWVQADSPGAADTLSSDSLSGEAVRRIMQEAQGQARPPGQ